MFTLPRINVRRIAIACLCSLFLFLGLAAIDNACAVAEVLKPDAVGLPREEITDEVEIETNINKRREMQAKMSEMADDDSESESVTEKLNLNEPVPQSTKEFVRDLGKDDSINSKLRR